MSGGRSCCGTGYFDDMAGFVSLLELVFRVRGSVVPMAAKVAAPAAMLAVVLKIAERLSTTMDQFNIYFRIQPYAFSGFSGLLGFLIVFRSSQAYTRYWNGGCLVQQMLGSWFDCASSVISFSRLSTKASKEQVAEFHDTVVKMFSLLTALCLARLEAGAQTTSQNSGAGADESGISERLKNLPVAGHVGLQQATVARLGETELKIELVFHWIQGLICSALDKGIISVPPPVASRAFQELGGGLVKFEDCMKICILPIPFPYVQTTIVLLGIHWLISPLTMCGSTESPILAALYTFTIVFTFWSLFFISMELENPFGEDENDLDVVSIQESMNTRLMVLVSNPAGFSPEITPEGMRTLGEICDVTSLFEEGPETHEGRHAHHHEAHQERHEPSGHLLDGGLLEQGLANLGMSFSRTAPAGPSGGGHRASLKCSATVPASSLSGLDESQELSSAAVTLPLPTPRSTSITAPHGHEPPGSIAASSPPSSGAPSLSPRCSSRCVQVAPSQQEEARAGPPPTALAAFAAEAAGALSGRDRDQQASEPLLSRESSAPRRVHSAWIADKGRREARLSKASAELRDRAAVPQSHSFSLPRGPVVPVGARSRSASVRMSDAYSRLETRVLTATSGEAAPS